MFRLNFKFNNFIVIIFEHSQAYMGKFFKNLTTTLFAKRKGLCYKHGHV